MSVSWGQAVCAGVSGVLLLIPPAALGYTTAAAAQGSDGPPGTGWIEQEVSEADRVGAELTDDGDLRLPVPEAPGAAQRTTGSPGTSATFPDHALEDPAHSVEVWLDLTGTEEGMVVEARGVRVDGMWTEWRTSRPEITREDGADDAQARSRLPLPAPVARLQVRVAVGDTDEDGSAETGNRTSPAVVSDVRLRPVGYTGEADGSAEESEPEEPESGESGDQDSGGEESGAEEPGGAESGDGAQETADSDSGAGAGADADGEGESDPDRDADTGQSGGDESGGDAGEAEPDADGGSGAESGDAGDSSGSGSDSGSDADAGAGEQADEDGTGDDGEGADEALPERPRPYSARVFATRIGQVGELTANGHRIGEDEHFVALPSRRGLSERGAGDYTVRVCTERNGRKAGKGEDTAPAGRCVYAPVWDVGPWNITDDYWNPDREDWTDLPRGLPQAQATRQDGYNGGLDGFGRRVLNPAGIDLADGTFNDGLKLPTNAWVHVDYLWTAEYAHRGDISGAAARDTVPVRSGPGTSHPERGLASAGASVDVVCHASGTEVTGPQGVSDMWFRISDRDYVPAAHVRGGNGAPACPDSDGE